MKDNKKPKSRTKYTKSKKRVTHSIAPKKTYKSKLVRPKNKKLNIDNKKNIKTIKAVLILIIFGVLLTVLWYILFTNNEMNSINNSVIKSAKSMLAYTEQDIKTAGIVGTTKQLKSEIQGFYDAPADLQLFMLKDYKAYKRNCVVNGSLLGMVSYKLVVVKYNSFALIQQGCNGDNRLILKKFTQKWTTIYSGNSIVNCSMVNDFDIPQSISFNCYHNGQLYINPNP